MKFGSCKIHLSFVCVLFFLKAILNVIIFYFIWLAESITTSTPSQSEPYTPRIGSLPESEYTPPDTLLLSLTGGGVFKSFVYFSLYITKSRFSIPSLFLLLPVVYIYPFCLIPFY